MANNENLIPQAHILTVEEQSAGGKASGEARKEKKAIKELINNLLDSQMKDNAAFADLADKMGIESTKSVKDAFTYICILNGLKSGELSDLEKIAKLIGEETSEFDMSKFSVNITIKE